MYYNVYKKFNDEVEIHAINLTWMEADQCVYNLEREGVIAWMKENKPPKPEGNALTRYIMFDTITL